MSDDVINAQIGAAARAYSEAKTRLAHSEALLQSISRVYAQAAMTMQDREGDNFTSATEIMTSIDGPRATIIGNERLIVLLNEHEQKRKEVAKTLKQLTSYGINVP